MKKLILSLCLLVPGALWAVTPSALVDGKVVFAIAMVRNVPVFNQEEKDRVIETVGGDITPLSSTTLELTIANSGLQFLNYTDYVNCVNSKEYTQDKIDDLKPTELRKILSGIQILIAENNKR
jgi:hypothetical protein